MAFGLAGCATPRPLVQKWSSEARPTTSPAGVLRTDGLYVCRGLKGIGSGGGLSVWPFVGSPVQLSSVEFLRFDAAGTVQRWETLEPISIEQARHFFRDRIAGEWAVIGTYHTDGSKLNFQVSGLTADRLSRSVITYVGFVYSDYIAVYSEGSAVLPDYVRYHYREYDFVPDGAGGSATRPAG